MNLRSRGAALENFSPFGAGVPWSFCGKVGVWARAVNGGKWEALMAHRNAP